MIRGSSPPPGAGSCGPPDESPEIVDRVGSDSSSRSCFTERGRHHPVAPSAVRAAPPSASRSRSRAQQRLTGGAGNCNQFDQPCRHYQRRRVEQVEPAGTGSKGRPAPPPAPLPAAGHTRTLMATCHRSRRRRPPYPGTFQPGVRGAPAAGVVPLPFSRFPVHAAGPHVDDHLAGAGSGSGTSAHTMRRAPGLRDVIAPPHAFCLHPARCTPRPRSRTGPPAPVSFPASSGRRRSAMRTVSGRPLGGRRCHSAGRPLAEMHGRPPAGRGRRFAYGRGLVLKNR